MLKPVGVPSSADPLEWQRLRAFLVASEMEPQAGSQSGRTPVQAAVQADARLRMLWLAQFPGKPLPFKVQESVAGKGASLPGGVKTQDGRYWWLVAYPNENPDGVALTFPVSYDEMAQMAASYDPAFRRASVVASNGGPAHLTGEFGIPRGKVDALQFDGFYLWALVSETLPGALEFAAELGAEDRSIRWVTELPELEGEPAYLWHIALLTGEQPALSNMPSNREFFRTPEAEGLKAAAGGGALRFRELSIGRQTMSEPKNEPGLVRGFLAELSSLLGGKEPVVPAPTAGPNAEDVAKAMAAIVEEKLKAATGTIEGLKAQVEALQKTTSDAASEARKSRVATSLDAAVRAGQLAPAQRPLLERALANATEEQVVEALTDLAKLPKVAALPKTLAVQVSETEVAELPDWMTSPDSMPADPRNAKIAYLAAQKASEGKTPEEKYDIYRREVYAALGQPLRTASLFGAN